jgi:3-phenylpropionate/trans-cinnamate dioxygenase ferredoxin component
MQRYRIVLIVLTEHHYRTPKSTWIKLCRVDELNNGEIRAFNSENGKMILLAKLSDKYYATDAKCTHQYFELSKGFLSAEEKTVTCPLHLSVFSLIDGKAQNPPSELPLMIYQTKVKDSLIYALI